MLAHGHTYTQGGDTCTVADRPYTAPGMFGEDVLRIPVRTESVTGHTGVVHTDHHI